MTPVANASLLIRAPAERVFNAFLHPETLTQFWLSRASGPLAPGKSATWEFHVPGAVAETRLQESAPHSRLVLEWEGDETAEVTFDQREDGFTRVEVKSAATGKTDAEAVANAIESTQGYTLVLANLKVLLETGKSGGIVEDKAILIAEKQTAKD